MPRLGDEEGIFWDEPVVEQDTISKAVIRKAIPLEGYVPPSSSPELLCDEADLGLDIETLDLGIQKGTGPADMSVRAGEDKHSRVVGVALGHSPDNTTYYPTTHESADRNIENPEQFYSELKSFAATYKGTIVGANLQYDLSWLKSAHSVEFPFADYYDVQFAAALIDEERFSYSLKNLGLAYLPEDQRKMGDFLRDNYGSKYIESMHKVDPGHAGIYAERDVDSALNLKKIFEPIITAEGLDRICVIEMAQLPLLVQMREAGVRVDVDAAEKARAMTIVEKQKTLDEIKRLSGCDVELWAAESVARAFDSMDIPYIKTKAKGKPSFTKPWLEAHDSPLAQLIVAGRAFDKIGGTFIENYILNAQVAGRLHTTFHPLKGEGGGTVTGRYSSSNPNLQNIPTRHPILGPLLRSMFIPEDDHDWGSIDWSQIEYRFLVHFARLNMHTRVDARDACKAYNDSEDADFHEVAARLANVPRKLAKGINFGVIYGMGMDTMATNLGIPVLEAKPILSSFHEEMPFLKDIYNLTAAEAEAEGFIRTISGRKRRFNRVDVGGQIYSSLAAAEAEGRDLTRERWSRLYTYRALNAKLQGSNADLMKKALVTAYEAGVFRVLVPHLTVHDEMNTSVPKSKEGREAFAELKNIMQNAAKLVVPIYADAGLGANWNEAKG